jgi:hypothetical protein
MERLRACRHVWSSWRVMVAMKRSSLKEGGDLKHMARCDKNSLHRAGCVLLTLLLVCACSSSTNERLPPEEIVSRASQRMGAMKGFHFLIERSGAPAFLDESQAIAFRRAEGDFVAPDRAQATVRIISPGLVAEVEIISIGEIQWETNLLSGAWQELAPNWGFNPTRLFDPEIGIQAILDSDVSSLLLIGMHELEELPGLELYQVQGDVKGEKLYELSFGMMGPQPMAIQLWVDPKTFELNRLVVSDPMPEKDEPTIWQMDFWDFDQIVEINPPLPSRE